jgi:hypothetical protein
MNHSRPANFLAETEGARHRRGDKNKDFMTGKVRSNEVKKDMR